MEAMAALLSSPRRRADAAVPVCGAVGGFLPTAVLPRVSPPPTRIPPPPPPPPQTTAQQYTGVPPAAPQYPGSPGSPLRHAALRHPLGADGLLRDALSAAAAAPAAAGWTPEPELMRRYAQRRAEELQQAADGEERRCRSAAAAKEAADAAQQAALTETEQSTRAAVAGTEVAARAAAMSAEVRQRGDLLSKGIASMLGSTWKRDGDVLTSSSDAILEVRWQKERRRTGLQPDDEEALEELAECRRASHEDTRRFIERMKRRQQDVDSDVDAAAPLPVKASSVTLRLLSAPSASSMGLPSRRTHPVEQADITSAMPPSVPHAPPEFCRATSPTRCNPPPVPTNSMFDCLPRPTVPVVPTAAAADGGPCSVRWKRREDVVDGVPVVSWDREVVPDAQE
eukprot:TRINITY_DN2965_c0_g1_i1.p1 TRINITY_DN2965_c0_g1~~TRINITY_DN2965_c0_g1_i1.p1  ORF type:complete len:397 (+),score=99.42 TRINITY_DN2965_c0_g1_i1:38-1228(+)